MDDPKLITVTDDVAVDILLNVWAKEEDDVFVMDMRLVTEEVRKHAYYKWEDAGCPNGRSEEFWAEAEQEIYAVLGLYLPSVAKERFMLV